eukprot:TRINITY_DN4194_c4_g1_i1.p1 TRINITY_DN4194_c4_g1~~TRINITY_DN4194_c4_g1_i1.p1  ORF type:complete len:1463 (+),score=421.63 TRINITY_DN4194_c4_g1_i1:14-4402(+)
MQYGGTVNSKDQHRNNKVQELEQLRYQYAEVVKELVFLEGGGNLMRYEETPAFLEKVRSYYQHHTRENILKTEQSKKVAKNSNTRNSRKTKFLFSESENKMSYNSQYNPLQSQSVAKQALEDARVLKKLSEMQRDGILSTKLIPKSFEPPRAKTHRDYLHEEMEWLSNDFREERKWKIACAKKLAQAVMKYHQDKIKEVKEKEVQEKIDIVKTAKWISNEVKEFWGQIEQLVRYKHQSKIDEKKQKVLNEHLNFLVGQTEIFSSMLAKDLAASTPAASQNNMEIDTSAPDEPIEVKSEKTDDDAGEFVAHEDEEDDESTLLQDEKAIELENGENAEDENKVLEEDNKIPIEQLIEKFGKPNRRKIIDELIEEKAKSKENGKEEEDEMVWDADGDEDGGGPKSKDVMQAAAKAASKIQPTGFTLKTTTVKTKVPFLLKYPLREYQHIGLDWLATMYEKKLNGILADEMGLGKTIMTISMLSHLACEKGNWGPHLIIVPTSVLLNWDMEFKKWCPAFKILTYFGSVKERKAKRVGWSRPNSFHICLTSYKLVIQDHKSFRKRPWQYIILDEAHNIKNFRSQRWQTLLSFPSKRRLLLTGTPLQNDLMELWALMHFLMPNVFASHSEFKDWFSNPLNTMIEGGETNMDLIQRLHSVLRPFILRRLKKDVEKQMPRKLEHIVLCPLSKRQRGLYEEFISNADTQCTLKSGNFLGIANILMQLRKVCNHPDLFESRPIISSFDMYPALDFHIPSLAERATEESPNLEKFLLIERESHPKIARRRIQEIKCKPKNIQDNADIALNHLNNDEDDIMIAQVQEKSQAPLNISRRIQKDRRRLEIKERYESISYLNQHRHEGEPIYGSDLVRLVTIERPTEKVINQSYKAKEFLNFTDSLRGLVLTNEERARLMEDTINSFLCIIPNTRAPRITHHCSHPNPSTVVREQDEMTCLESHLSPATQFLQPAIIRSQMYFPDRALVQYDCGKLQQLDLLLRKLKREGHRALIFTQMTKMLDVLEVFLNLHGHTYMRLDGTTNVEKRQQMMERYNKDNRVFLFILSTRAGGLGINLIGADTVIFYDSDWNPAMDQQAQDRCHRIGQTREVNIYRLISEHTIEENILKKARQKRDLQRTVIKEANFTTEFFKTIDLRSLVQQENKEKQETEGQEDAMEVVKEEVVEDAQLRDVKAETNMKAMEKMSAKDLATALAAAEDETDAEAAKKLMEENNEEEKEFSDDENNNSNKEDKTDIKSEPNHTTGSTTTTATATATTTTAQKSEVRKKFDITTLLGKAEWEDALSGVQLYALKFLQVVNPVLDEKEILNQHLELEKSEQQWKENQLKLKQQQEEDSVAVGKAIQTDDTVKGDIDEEALWYEPDSQLDEEKAKEIYEKGQINRSDDDEANNSDDDEDNTDNKDTHDGEDDDEDHGKKRRTTSVSSRKRKRKSDGSSMRRSKRQRRDKNTEYSDREHT